MIATALTRSSRKSTLRDCELDDLTVTLHEAQKKKKRSAKFCNKKTEKNKFHKKDRRCKDSEFNHETYNVIKIHQINKENRGKKIQTGSKVERTVLEDVSSIVSSKSLKQKTVQGHNYCLNTTPLDDLISSTISTPPSVERLFTNGLGKRSSISSTPKSSRVNVSREKILEKRSLKHKQWVMSSLRRKSRGHEDDLFENSEITESLPLDDSGLSDIKIATPNCTYSISPTNLSKTPPFKDCYSPSHIRKARKAAEEYMHMRSKRRINSSAMEDVSSAGKQNTPLKSNINGSSKAKRLEFSELMDTFNKKLERQNSIKMNSDSDEDCYFKDVSF